MKLGAVGSFAAIAILFSVSAFAQITPLDQAAVDDIIDGARTAQKAHPADPNRALLAFVQWYTPKYGQAFEGEFPVWNDKTLKVALITPRMALRTFLTQRLRLVEPIQPPEQKTLTDVALSIEPKAIDSPNIIKVILAKNGALIEASGSTLESRVFRTALGRESIKGAAHVSFPVSAFAPGSPTTITLMPEGAGNLTIDIKDFDLRQLR